MTFAKDLTTWYQQNKRDLPFRHNPNPYYVWVSEIMAQQTQIATMLPYFKRWIKHYPTIESLAQAPIDSVLKLWEGLGYYRRAHNLLLGAQYVMEHFNGQLPTTKDLLMTIPGIGDYTASAIASICFNEPVIVIDGNVKRVASRVFDYPEDVSKVKAHRYFSQQLLQHFNESDMMIADYNQALMELGALICTPTSPLCEFCPLKDYCQAHKNDTIHQRPVLPIKKKVPVYHKAVLLDIKDHQILISTDDRDGLMTGLIRLPQIDQPSSLQVKPVLHHVHKFTHLHWKINVYWLKDLNYPMDTTYWRYIDFDELTKSRSMITAHRKILKQLKLI